MKQTAVALGAVLALGLCPLPVQAQEVHELYPDEFEGSSVLPASDYGDYWVRNTGDHDLSTAWVEGVSGYGYGEYIQLYIPEGTVVVGAVIYPGYLKSEDLFWKNAAPTVLTFSSGAGRERADVTQAASSYQTASSGVKVAFQAPLISDGIIQVTVEDVRGGNTYTDTCISELHLMGYMPEPGDAGAAAAGAGVVVDGGNQDTNRVTFERIVQNGYEHALVRGYDPEQQVVWTHETDVYPCAQCDRVSDIGPCNDLYYFVDDGIVTTLDPDTGEVVWRSDVTVGSPPQEAFDFDQAGNLYIAGYLGPDLTILTPEGKVLGQFDQLSEDYYWPFIVKVEEDGFVLITYESSDLGNGQYGSLKADVRSWVTPAP